MRSVSYGRASLSLITVKRWFNEIRKKNNKIHTHTHKRILYTQTYPIHAYNFLIKDRFRELCLGSSSEIDRYRAARAVCQPGISVDVAAVRARYKWVSARSESKPTVPNLLHSWQPVSDHHVRVVSAMVGHHRRRRRRPHRISTVLNFTLPIFLTR